MHVYMHRLVTSKEVCLWSQNGASKDAPYGAKRIAVPMVSPQGCTRRFVEPYLYGGKMRIVSVINYKGGVGKTSLTANLGAELAWRGKRVLLIDLDAQASLTFSFIKPDEWVEKFEKKKYNQSLV